MTNKELVNQISGLNSTSTLKNWIQLIKEISGKEFKKIKIPVLPNVWWNGKNAILTSVLKKCSTLFMAEIFDAIFL